MSALITINYISTASIVLPVLAAFINYRHYDTTLKIAAWYFILSSLFEVAGLIGIQLKVHNNAPLMHAFVLMSTAFLSIVYYRSYYDALLKKVTLILGYVVVALIIANAIFYEGIWAFPSVANTAEGILMIGLSLAYFYQLFNRQEFIHIEKLGLFWINSGVLMYFSVNIFLFMLYNHIQPQDVESFWAIHSVTNIIANFLYTIGLLCRTQKITS